METPERNSEYIIQKEVEKKEGNKKFILLVDKTEAFSEQKLTE